MQYVLYMCLALLATKQTRSEISKLYLEENNLH